MPIYEYECQACGHLLEIFQRSSDPDPSKCPNCGKNKLNKIISATTFKLKGAGWYATDYSTKGKKGSDDTSAKEGANISKEVASSTDSAKPAATENKQKKTDDA